MFVAIDMADESPAASSALRLTDTQRAILVALCRPRAGGNRYATPATNQEIAAEVFLSVDAVKAHLRALYRKFGVEPLPHNQKRARLVELVMEGELISLPAEEEAAGDQPPQPPPLLLTASRGPVRAGDGVRAAARSRSAAASSAPRPWCWSSPAPSRAAHPARPGRPPPPPPTGPPSTATAASPWKGAPCSPAPRGPSGPAAISA